ncbi:MAG: hypothetical protein ACI94Y_000974 [Maribacter sp.]|jgi:hypothetical protein
MKNLCYLILLSFITIATQSCKDNKQTFEPSLDLEEYVLLNFNGVERLYTNDYSAINVYNYQEEGEEPFLLVSVIPYDFPFTMLFNLKIKNPIIGDFVKEQLNFKYTDVLLDNSIDMSCDTFGGCEGDMEVTIHEYDEVERKTIGEFSGTLSNFNDPENADQSFEGEFVVFTDY